MQAGDEIGMVASFAASEGAAVESRFAFHDVLVTEVQGLEAAADGEQTEQAAGRAHGDDRPVDARHRTLGVGRGRERERLVDARERNDRQFWVIAGRSGKRVG